MARRWDLFFTALAPLIWGSTYIVTTELLHPDLPLTNATLRALPAGLFLTLWVCRLPPSGFLLRLFILAALNFALFWAALFVAAGRLPGGMAATLSAVQPVIVLLLARIFLNTPLTAIRVGAAVGGVLGVGLLLAIPRENLDLIGVLAALLGALSMACGVILTRLWSTKETPPLVMTAWQLSAAGVMLSPFALLFEQPFQHVWGAGTFLGALWLGMMGAGISYLLWFRGIERLGPSVVTSLGFLSPLAAVVLGWAILGETLSTLQYLGAAVVIICAYLGSKPKSE